MDVEAVMNSLQHLFYTMQTTPFVRLLRNFQAVV